MVGSAKSSDYKIKKLTPFASGHYFNQQNRDGEDEGMHGVPDRDQLLQRAILPGDAADGGIRAGTALRKDEK